MSKSSYDGTHSTPSLCGSNGSIDESFIGTDVGAAQLDLTNQYIPFKYSVDRYLEDFRSCVAEEFLLGYTWSNPAEAIRQSEVDMERFLQHVEKKLGSDFSDFKNNEIKTFIPGEGSGQLVVFPTRQRVSDGELDPWELSTGLNRVQPRRPRIMTTSGQPSQQLQQITSGRAVIDHATIQPGGAPPSDPAKLLPPSNLPGQLEPPFLDQFSDFASSFGASTSIIEEPSSASSHVRHTPDAVSAAQSFLKYPSIIPDTLLDLGQDSATVPFVSMAQIHKENARPIFQLRRDRKVHRSTLLPSSVTNAVRHGTSAAYQNSSTSVPAHPSNDSIPASLPDLVFGSPSEWSSASPFTSIDDYSIPAFLNTLETEMEPVSHRNKNEDLEEGALTENSITTAEVAIDWDYYINFQDTVDG